MNKSALEAMRSERAREQIWRQAFDGAWQYMQHDDDRHVYPTEQAVADLSVFHEDLPDGPTKAGELLAQLQTYGAPASVRYNGRYYGFVNGDAIPAGMATRILTGPWDQNPAMWVMSPVAAELEAVCERWLVDLFNFPEQSAMALVGGTTTATLCGLAMARHHLLHRQGWDVNEKGLYDAPRLRVITCAQSHSSAYKAIALLGLGKANVEQVPADDQGRMRLNELPELDQNCILLLQAGNVNTGAFEDFSSLCARAKAADAWVHVDGAFGLWAALSPRTAHLTRDMHLADSWSVDGHKTLNTPYDCGIVFCRDRALMIPAMQAWGSYLTLSQKMERRDSIVLGPDMSRRARSMELWATLKSMGRQGLAELIDNLCDRAQQFAEGLRAMGFRILNEVVFNQVLIATESNARTKAVLDHIQAANQIWCGDTTWRGAHAIRLSVCGWSTTKEDIDLALSIFQEAVAKEGV